MGRAHDQFVLQRGPLAAPEGWVRRASPTWTLAHHPSLPVTELTGRTAPSPGGSWGGWSRPTGPPAALPEARPARVRGARPRLVTGRGPPARALGARPGLPRAPRGRLGQHAHGRCWRIFRWKASRGGAVPWRPCATRRGSGASAGGCAAPADPAPPTERARRLAATTSTCPAGADRRRRHPQPLAPDPPTPGPRPPNPWPPTPRPYAAAMASDGEDFGARMAAAYAAEGAAIDLGRACATAEVVPEAVVQLPRRHAEPPRPHRRGHRHRQDEDAAADGRAAVGHRRAGVRRRRQGRPHRACAARRRTNDGSTGGCRSWAWSGRRPGTR